MEQVNYYPYEVLVYSLVSPFVVSGGSRHVAALACSMVVDDDGEDDTRCSELASRRKRGPR